MARLIRNLNGLTFLGKFFVPLLVRYRNDLALLEVINKESRLLDVGGENGYLISKAECAYGYSLDANKSLEIVRRNKKIVETVKPGYFIKNKLPLKANDYDYVTMIAFAEHLEQPKEIMREVYRVLRKKGRFIMTTPLPTSEFFIDILDKGSSQLSGKLVKDDHKQYFDKEAMNKLLKGMFKLIKYKKFELGVNQLFVYERI